MAVRQKPEGDGRVLILLMEQVTVGTQLTITRKVRIQIAGMEEPEPDGNGQSAEAEEISLSDIRRAISFLLL